MKRKRRGALRIVVGAGIGARGASIDFECGHSRLLHPSEKLPDIGERMRCFTCAKKGKGRR